MNRYQAGISEFTESASVVFGISTDPLERNREFAESLKLEFALLSDEKGAVAGDYGVLIEGRNMAKRTTFVVGKDGNVAYIAEGADAMDPAGAAGACSQLD